MITHKPINPCDDCVDGRCTMNCSRPMATETTHDPARHDAMVKAISAVLVGKPPEIQGAVLADLLAMWLAGHPSFARDEVLAQHIELVLELIEPNEKILFGEAGHPQKAQ